MDWTTKDYIDSRFDELEEKLDLIMDNLNIKDDSDIEDEDLEEDIEEDSKDII